MITDRIFIEDGKEYINFEGTKVQVDTSLPITPGCTYLAERNVEPVLLTCKNVNEEGGWVNPVSLAYPYDLHECVVVIGL